MAYKDSRISGFHQYMVAVDREIQARTGLGFLDIEDWTYRDAYDDGVDPEDAAIQALENSGWEGE